MYTKTKVMFLLTLILVLALSQGAFATFNPIPDTPKLVDVEFHDNREESGFVIVVEVSESALNFDGSYYGSGEASVEFWGRVDSGEWFLYDEFFVRHYNYGDRELIITLMLGGRDAATEMRARLTYSHTGDDGDTVVVNSGWSNTVNTGVPVNNLVTQNVGSDSKATTWSNSSDWAYNELSMADSYGLIPGVLFDQDFLIPVTRAQFAAVTVRLYEQCAGSGVTFEPKSVFSDCEDIDVLKAHSLGIVNGVGDNLFDPYGKLTREQLATMLWRAVLLIEPEIDVEMQSPPAYSDVNLISDWATESVMNMGTLDFVKGVGDGKFDPGGNATIEQSVIIALRIYDYFHFI